MLTLADTQKPDAVETLFCQSFEILPQVPLDNELTEILAHLLGAKAGPINIPEKEKPQLYQIIEKRLAASFTFEITDARLILFLTAVAELPGNAIMYLTYLQYCAKHSNRKNVSLNDFCETFRHGVPSKEDLKNLWYSLKISDAGMGSDNLLDYQSAMQSIHFQ